MDLKGNGRVTAKSASLIGGRYRLEETIGRGGMAAVHSAVDTQLGRPVAVKVMRPELGEDPTFRGRFVNEARNAASISHPNVVTVFDFGTDGPAPYLVMELVDGGDLAGLIAADAPLVPQRAVTIAAEVASALGAAHSRGIIHRDVKPGNILVGADGRTRVADFGIARATGEQSLTNTGTSLGSVEYFSPEQARGEPATAASDVYALGAVLYEMLTGKRPFNGDSSYAVAVARLETAPPDPRAVRAEIPKSLAAIVQRAMATDPRNRYVSAAAMGTGLTKWLARNPAPAVTPVAVPVAGGTRASAGADTAALPSVKSKRASAASAAPAIVKRTGRKAALAAAAAAAPLEASAASAAETRPVAVVAVPSPAQSEPAPVGAVPVVAAEHEDDRRRRRPALLFLAAAVMLLAIVGFIGGRMIGGPGEPPLTGITVGEPRGEVLAATPEPTASPTVAPTAEPTAVPTAEPTAVPTAAPTQAPVAAATPAPPPPAATPVPTAPAVAAAVTPDQTVATWYSYVEDGRFDAAYSLWSQRMKNGFPRQGNLDNRWRDTADVRIIQLYVIEQTQSTAKVHIEFVETKDNGSSRRFIGWWELVRSGDHWLLDWPHF